MLLVNFGYILNFFVGRNFLEPVEDVLGIGSMVDSLDSADYAKISAVSLSSLCTYGFPTKVGLTDSLTEVWKVP